MKKVMVLLMVLLLLFSSFGCASGKKEEVKETATDAVAPIDEKKATPTDGSASEAEVIDDTDFYPAAVLYVDLITKLGPIPTPKKDLRIGYAAKAFENEFWRSVKDGALAEATQLKERGIHVDVKVEAAQGESDEQGQLALMNSMVNEKFDAILLSPISDGNLIPAIEKAQEAGIPLVNSIGGFVNKVPHYVGPRHYMSGEIAAAWLAKKLGSEKAQVAVVMGMPKESAARSRTQGFKDWFEKNAPHIEVVASENADWDRMKAKDVVDVWMKKYPELKGIYCNNDTMAMGALEAVKSAGNLGKCFVVGNDGTGEAYESIRNDELSASVDIFPYYAGVISVDVALRLIGGQEVPRVIFTNQAIIDKSNVDIAAEEVISWKALEFK